MAAERSVMAVTQVSRMVSCASRPSLSTRAGKHRAGQTGLCLPLLRLCDSTNRPHLGPSLSLLLASFFLYTQAGPRRLSTYVSRPARINLL